jgi:DNA-binding transcriptional regulator YiaG
MSSGAAEAAVVMPSGEQLRQVRHALGWSQRTLAGAMYVSVFTVYRWEHDRNRPRPIALRRLRALLSTEDVQRVLAEALCSQAGRRSAPAT